MEGRDMTTTTNEHHTTDEGMSVEDQIAPQDPALIRIRGLEHTLETFRGLNNNQAMTITAQEEGLSEAKDALIAASAELGEVQRALQEITAERDRLRTSHTEMYERLMAQAREHQEWKANLVSELHAEADRRDMCSEFDDWMRDHDLPGRTQEFSVDVTVTYSTSVTIMATSPEEAREQARMDNDHVVREQVRQELGYEELEDVSTGDVEAV